MTTYEEIWVLIGLGVGFLLFIEGFITYIARLIRRISEDSLKMVAGIAILALAIFNLKNPPLWLSWVLVGSLLLILAIVYLTKILRRKRRVRV